MTTKVEKGEEGYRTPEMQEFVDETARRIFGRSLTGAQKQGVCVTCGKIVTGFKDELSKKEYKISGMCQTCQDETFGVEEE